MSQNNFVYPITPTNVPASITEPSPAFKKMVTKVVTTIVLFFVVYILMMVLSAALAIGCMYAGVYVIGGVGGIWGLLGGIGMIGVGVLVFVFLIKFIFAVTKHDRAGFIEITEEEQPRLFAFIRQLTMDTQTPFPKRIFLTADVNAAVFYDSSFWSMFLPIKKNLIIGLGLVNSVNVSEFKAVMAHEFGHFSQRSMKLGSFVYNVNMIVHNMLFGNNSYGRFLQGWASLHGLFALFAHITAQIVYAIQWVLRQMYGIINKSNMELSREMEFHADAVAASVSGSKNLVSALRRIEIGQSAYEIMIGKCNVLFRQKKISSNIYKGQRAAVRTLASDLKFPLQYEMAVINDEFIIDSNLSRVNFKDQWASHPSSDDREKHLKELAVEAEIVQDSAWVLFDNMEGVQQELTNTIYENAPNKSEVTKISDKEFEDSFDNEINKQIFPKEYNGFYDNHTITPFNIDEVIADTKTEPLAFEEIFTPENALLSKKLLAIANDIATLKAIIAGTITAKSFDFDSVKYKKQEASTILAQLETEQKEMQDKLDRLDKAAIRAFISKAKQQDPAKAQDLISLYKQHFTYRTQTEAFLIFVNNMLTSLAPLYQGQLQLEQVNEIISTLTNQKDPAFKEWLQRWMEVGAFEQNPADKEWILKFIKSNYVYFDGSSFFNNELNELTELSEQSYAHVTMFVFRHFNSILQKQVSLMGAKVLPLY